MISGGQITSIYSAGELGGTWSNFGAGPVNALTNISVAQDHYSTRAATLWLVENRAILTRMLACKPLNVTVGNGGRILRFDLSN